MEISKIVIKNFKGIEQVELSPLTPINVLIGRNNSGKSSVLSALNYMAKHWDGNGNISNQNVIAENHFRISGGGTPEPFSTSISVKQSIDELEQLIYQAVVTWNGLIPPSEGANKDIVKSLIQEGLFKEMTFNFIAKYDEKYIFLDKIQTSIRNANDTVLDLAVNNSKPLGNTRGSAKHQRGLNGFLVLPVNRLFQTDKHGNRRIAIIEDLKSQGKIGLNQQLGVMSSDPRQNGEAEFCRAIILEAHNFLYEVFSKSFIVPPYRHANDSGNLGTQALDTRGANLVSYLNYLQTNQHRRFQAITDLIKKIAPEVGRFHPRQIANQGSLELAYEWDEAEIVRLKDMGGGMEQLLILACFLVSKNKNCMMWEEPESHLHPGAQDILLNELIKLIGKRTIFLTTHSPVFVRPHDKIAVHTITNSDGKSAKGITLSEEDFDQAINIIGSRPGHLAQADIVVHVEGKSGAAVFEGWLNLWPERKKVLGHLQLVVNPFNVEEAGDKDFDLSGVKKITTNMIVFADKDNDRGMEEPKKKRQALKAKCKKLGVPCILTDERQIEDYFTDDAIQRAVPGKTLKCWGYDSAKPNHEQWGRKWKVYNRKIASSMSWDDVKIHKDIMAVFEDIEKYAQILHPVTNEAK